MRNPKLLLSQLNAATLLVFSSDLEQSEAFDVWAALCVAETALRTRSIDLGFYLKVAKERLGANNREIASIAGVSASTISRWTNGHKPVFYRALNVKLRLDDAILRNDRKQQRTSQSKTR